MFREADEPSRNLHPSFRPKPLSNMQMLSQASKLDDSARQDKITNVDVFHSEAPPTVPCTYDTVYDPSNPDADWSGMVSTKNQHKKHTQNHASQRLGITQCEHGIVAKEERQEWGHRRQPENSNKNATTFVIGGINNDEDRFKTEYRRLAHHEATNRDQLTLDKRQKAIRRIPDPAQARSLRDRHEGAGSVISQQSPRYGEGETPRSSYQSHAPFANERDSERGGEGGAYYNPQDSQYSQSHQQQAPRFTGNSATLAKKSFISDLASQISSKVEAPKKTIANDSAFSHNRLLVTDNFQPFPGYTGRRKM